MFTQRNLLIAGISLAVLAVVFIAALDWESRKDYSSSGVVVRAPQPAEPVNITDVTGTNEPAEALEAAGPEQPVVTEPAVPEVVTYDVAESAYLERRYEDATVLFARYTERKSGNPWGFYMLGLSSWKAGDLDGAETAFLRAIELDDTHAKSFINLSRVLLDDGRPDEALGRLDKVLELDPESGEAYRLKGRAFHQRGERVDAEQAYREAIKLNPQDAWSMNNLALLFIEQNRFDEALPALARAIEINGEEPVFHNNLGMVLENTGCYNAAQAAYELAVVLDESYEKASMNLDRLSLVEKDPDRSVVDMAFLAQQFAETVERWTGLAESGEQPEWIEMGMDSIVVSEAGVADADSTDHN